MFYKKKNALNGRDPLWVLVNASKSQGLSSDPLHSPGLINDLPEGLPLV